MAWLRIGFIWYNLGSVTEIRVYKECNYIRNEDDTLKQIPTGKFGIAFYNEDDNNVVPRITNLSPEELVEKMSEISILLDFKPFQNIKISELKVGEDDSPKT